MYFGWRGRFARPQCVYLIKRLLSEIVIKESRGRDVGETARCAPAVEEETSCCASATARCTPAVEEETSSCASATARCAPAVEEETSCCAVAKGQLARCAASVAP